MALRGHTRVGNGTRIKAAEGKMQLLSLVGIVLEGREAAQEERDGKTV